MKIFTADFDLPAANENLILLKKELKEIEELTEAGRDDAKRWKEITEISLIKNKITATEFRHDQIQQTTMPAAEVYKILGSLYQSLMAEAKDDEQRQRIKEKFVLSIRGEMHYFANLETNDESK